MFTIGCIYYYYYYNDVLQFNILQRSLVILHQCNLHGNDHCDLDHWMHDIHGRLYTCTIDRGGAEITMQNNNGYDVHYFFSEIYDLQ